MYLLVKFCGPTFVFFFFNVGPSHWTLPKFTLLSFLAHSTDQLKVFQKLHWKYIIKQKKGPKKSPLYGRDWISCCVRILEEIQKNPFLCCQVELPTGETKSLLDVTFRFKFGRHFWLSRLDITFGRNFWT